MFDFSIFSIYLILQVAEIFICTFLSKKKNENIVDKNFY